MNDSGEWRWVLHRHAIALTKSNEVFMLRRLTAVGAAPASIILFMLFLAYLQPLDAGRLVDADAVRTGRFVLMLLPYGLAALGLGIGIRFRNCGVLIAMLSLGAAYLALTRPFFSHAGHNDWPAGFHYAVSALLVPNYLLAAWAENAFWRSRRGLWALLLSIGGCLIFWGDQLHLWGPTFAWGMQLEATLGLLMESIHAHLDASAELAAFSDRLAAGIDGGVLVGATSLLLLVRAVWTGSPVLAGLSGSLVVTAPQMIRWAGDVSLGLAYSAATLMVLVGLLESVFKRAYRDALTGLPGRRDLDDALRHMGRRYAIAMLDVDHFKRFNDRYGHATGDQVLKMIAAQAGRIRRGRAFRYGGEEFAVVFAGRAVRRADTAMEAFRQHLAQTPFIIRKRPRPTARRRQGRSARGRALGTRQQVKVTVSIGLAAADGRKRKPGEVLQAADKALYKAKRGGRNRLCREA